VPTADPAARRAIERAATIERLVTAGRPVVRTGVAIDGDVRIQPEVRALFALRSSISNGTVLARSTVFTGL